MIGVFTIEEELELYKNIKEEEQEEDIPMVINGDVIISVKNYGGRVDLKSVRNQLTKKLKNEIKERDSKTCVCCGKKFETHLEVHHIMPVSRYPDLVCIPENMVSLCQRCHAKYHDLFKEEEGAASFAKFLKLYGK